MSKTLRFVFSTMNSGKTANMQMRAYNFGERNIPYIILKSSIDTRDGNGVVHSRPLGDMNCYIVNPKENIYERVGEILKERGKLKYILVDEAQFLSEEQVDQLSDVVDYLDINVICYGLRTDFKTRLFPGSKRLFEIADVFEEIKTTCSCGERNNIFNARIDSEGKVVTEGKQIEVGGEDRYLSMCRKCYKDSIKKEEN